MAEATSQNTSGIDLSSLLQAINAQEQQSKAAIQQITDSLQQVQAIGDTAAQAVVDAARSEGVVKSAEETGKLRAQQAARKTATVLGTNLDDASELITTLGAQMRESAVQADAAREKYFDKANVSFFDNPLDWIDNNLLGGTDRAAGEYNRYATRFNSASARMDDITSKTTAAAQAQNAIAETRTAASVESASDSLAQKAAAEAAKIKQQNLIFNINGIKAINDMNGDSLNRLFQFNSASMQEQHLQIAKENLAEAKSLHAIQLAERMDKIEKKNADLKEIQELGQTINNGRASLGLPAIPPQKAVQMLKMGGEIGDQIKHQYSIGATAASIGRPIISDNVGEAARVIVTSQATPALKATPAAPVVNLITARFGDVVSGKAVKTIDLKDAKQVNGAVTKLVMSDVAAMATNIKTGDASNIFAPPDLASIANLKAVQETALYKKLLAPAIQNGMSETNPELLISLAATGIKNGQVDYKQALTGLETIFKGAVALNNETKDYMRFGIPKQTNYITEVDDPTTLWRTKVDVTDPTKLGNLLSKKLRGYVIGAGRTLD